MHYTFCVNLNWKKAKLRSEKAYEHPEVKAILRKPLPEPQAGVLHHFTEMPKPKILTAEIQLSLNKAWIHQLEDGRKVHGNRGCTCR